MRFRLPLYIFVISFLLFITDLQYIFKVDLFFTRSIAIIILLTFFPGFLLYRLLYPFKELTAKIIVYSVGLSISFIMFGVLALNVVYISLLNLIPLVTETLLISLNVLLIPLLFIHAYFFNEKDPVIPLKLHNGCLYDWVLMGVATLFPLLSIAGTTLLNNGGTNVILISNLIAIGVYIFIVSFFWRYLHKSVFSYAIFMIGLSVLFNMSLRGWFVTGSDILSEYRMFQSTLTHGFWTNTLEKHSYNACISITLLPSVYAKLLEIQDDYIFKFIFQIFFAFVPLIVYVFTLKFANRIVSFFSALIFMSFPIFVNSMSMHIRQEIAFLFFALMILSIFEEKMAFIPRLVMMTFFGYGMIISHYSTTFIALGLLTIWYALDLIVFTFKKWLLPFVNKSYTSPQYKHKVSIIFLILMYAFSFYWYTQVVNLGSNLRRLEKKVVSNLPNLFSDDVRVDQTSLSNQFNIFYKPANKNVLLNNYVKEVNNIAAQSYSNLYYPPETYKEYTPLLIEQKNTTHNLYGNLFKYAVIYMELIKKFQKILTIIGVLILAYLFLKNKVDKDILIVSISSLVLLLAFMILPYFTIAYDILRTTQQLLIILGFSTIIGGLYLIKFLGERIKYICLSIFVISYFFIYTNLYQELVGGFSPAIQFHNEGSAYERFYVLESEKKAITWLEKNKKSMYLTQSDPDSVGRLIMNTLSPVNTTASILPSRIYRNSYIYLNHFNVNQGVTYVNYQGESLRFTIPNKFLNENKNLLYNNKNSKIFQ